LNLNISGNNYIHPFSSTSHKDAPSLKSAHPHLIETLTSLKSAHPHLIKTLPSPSLKRRFHPIHTPGTMRKLFKHVALHSNAIDFLKIVYGSRVELPTVDLVSNFWDTEFFWDTEISFFLHFCIFGTPKNLVCLGP
jgi:hypothetical protein